jgi:2-succinyl-5-enolpyruvyl-6-hydroxy-3-cyclohexene-1-carboxylate synthase
MGVEKLDVSGSKKSKKSSQLPIEEKKKRKKKEKLETPEKRERRKKKEKRRLRKAEKLRESTELAIIEANHDMLLVGEVVGATNTEQEYMDEYRNMFTSLQNLKSDYELMMGEKPQSKDVYALMSMYSQMRECINDMRLINDSGEQAEHLCRTVLEPFLKSVADSMIQSFYKTMSAITASAPESQIVDLTAKLKEITATSSLDVQKAYDTAKGSLTSELAPGQK